MKAEHSIQSDWVIEEAEEGKERGILVPAFLDPVRPPRGFRGIQAADLTGWSPERPSPAFDSFLADLGVVLGAPYREPSPPSSAAEVSPAKQQDEPITPQQVVVVDPAGGNDAGVPLASGTVNILHVFETPTPPGQPAPTVDGPIWREVEASPAPAAGGQERPAETALPHGALRATGVAHPVPFAGRWWLGIILIVCAISAAGYAYWAFLSPSEPTLLSQKTAPTPDAAATPVPVLPADEAANPTLGLQRLSVPGPVPTGQQVTPAPIVKSPAVPAHPADDAANQSDKAAAPVTDCDRLAGSLYDTEKQAPGVALQDIDTARAIPACRAAVTNWPQEARFAFQYGRALTKAGDDAEAVRWYKKAADQGLDVAQNNLGVMYENGRGGLAKDDAEAVRWYKKAADQGNAGAKQNLARLGQTG